MKLLNEDIIKDIPKLYETEPIELPNKIAHVRFFSIWNDWAWYLVEFDGNDLCFGYVEGHENEFGYFRLSELESIKGPFGLGIQRDIIFLPTQIGQLESW